MDDVLNRAVWRLVQLRPNCLGVASRNLARHGFRVFCPVEETTRRRGGQFVSVRAPVFPGYLFVAHAGHGAPLRVVNSTYGVSRLVSFADAAPAEVPAEIVMGLMARCDESGLLNPPDSLERGEGVRIMSGPFADFVGTVETLGPNERVWVLLDLLGGVTRVALAGRSLQRA